MNTKQEFSIEVGGKTLTLEIGSFAQQTNAAVLAKYGQTVVLVTTVMSHKDKESDYMPLKVDYEERFYAAGKILGSRFMRREGRPSEDAILSGRLIDRTIRPLFDQRIRREIQVVATVLAIDEQNDPDTAGLIAASTALGISNIPWSGPVAGVRIAKIGNEFVVNPTNKQINSPECVFETFASGPAETINMVELAGKQASEKEVMEGFALAQKEIDHLIEFQNKIIKKIGKKKEEVALATVDAKLKETIEAFLSDKLENALYQPDKVKQYESLRKLKDELFAHLETVRTEGETINKAAVEFIWGDVTDALVHKNILEKEKRPDGRKLDEVRALSGEVKLFERTHGSAVFVRGNTQALAVTTLGPPGQEQLIESMETTGTRRFMLHYNFPAYSVGEIGNFRGPGRREIGHGALAKKAIEPLIPSQEEFPYTIRVVSEIMSSNGSSSMATTCASILSLMDAGVPIKKAAAGIAMGLILGEKNKYKVLTDIQGPEDHYGDMDFKIAGTEDGVTALQLDVKVNGLTLEIIQKTLEQAKQARLHILQFMKTVLPAPRTSLSPYAPIIVQIRINPEKIGAVIGSGGKTINGLIKKHELVSIDIEEDGRVFVSADSPEKAKRATEEIQALTKEYAVGEIVEGKVIKIMDFGAIVDLGGGQDGMIHVSELKNGYVKTVNEVLKLGDFVRAKVVRVEEGRIGLSLKQME